MNPLHDCLSADFPDDGSKMVGCQAETVGIEGDGDITEWLVWYIQKLEDALDEADTIVTTILNKSFFWQKSSAVPMTERQTQMLNLFLDGYEAKITSKTWATRGLHSI